MAVDHLDGIAYDGARILAAYRSKPDGRVPWSDRWTVRSVARHVAGSHHAVALILSDRPIANFEQAAALPRIEADEPEFPAWFSGNTRRLLTQCSTVPPAAVCWSPHPLLAGTGAYWTRRIAHDTLVHRWDPDTAADAVDEVLDVGLRVTRAVADAPAGPAIRLACTDAPQAWHLDLAEVGRLTIHTEPIDVAVTLRGTAEALLLWLWGRIDIGGGEIDVDGDRSVIARWTELLPTS